MNTGRHNGKKRNGGGGERRLVVLESVCESVCVCERKRAKGQKESKSIVGFCLYPQWIVLVNIYIVMFVQLRTPTLSLASASQTVIKGI